MDWNRYPNFKVGQEAESKSYSVGYRSAWFRCKIRGMSNRRGELGFSLEFFDYPDEKIHWTKLCQRQPEQSTRSQNQNKEELMVRPPFPPSYRKSQLPDPFPTSVVVVIVEDNWKVGDLVDWWCHNCYWSGRITKLLGNDKVLIKLPEPPVGEGKSYVALCKDLRPSLDWSLEDGWTIPKREEYSDSQSCARLICQSNQGAKRSEVSVEPQEEHPTPMESIEIVHNCGNDVISEAAAVSPTKTTPRMRERRFLDYLEEIWIDERNYWASAELPDTIDASIMELEELSEKIKWLKDLLKFGIGWSNAMKPSWEFMKP